MRGGQCLSLPNGSRLGEDDLIPYPIEKHGTPEEVMETILFLISDEASYITGQIVNVSGGLQIPLLGPVLSHEGT